MACRQVRLKIYLKPCPETVDHYSWPLHFNWRIGYESPHAKPFITAAQLAAEKAAKVAIKQAAIEKKQRTRLALLPAAERDVLEAVDFMREAPLNWTRWQPIIQLITN